MNWDTMADILIDTGLDLLRLLPFLFLAYLMMEVLEHKMNNKLRLSIRRAGYAGPAVGAVLGVVPQCGFSAAAAGLYSGKIITMGTLLAIFWSTSDEMLPIFLSNLSEGTITVPTILLILGIKVGIGMVFGFLVDFIIKGREHMTEKGAIHDLCAQEKCNCERGILKPAILHTVKVALFIALVSLALNVVIELVGEQTLAGLIQNRVILGPILASVVGLIPNCAASVLLTELYLSGILSFGSMMAGLLVGAGVGLIVLLRTNKNMRNNLRIIAILYGVSVGCGIVMNLLPF